MKFIPLSISDFLKLSFKWVLSPKNIYEQEIHIYLHLVPLFSIFQAGMDNKRLAIILDSKAAFIYCKDLPVKKFDGESDSVDMFSLGQRCLLLNAGGKSQTPTL